MIPTLIALVSLAPSEMRLPAGAMCPDAVTAEGAVHAVYGDGRNGWYTRLGRDGRVRINSDDGTVHAGGERGPKVAMGTGAIYAAWQGDYRQGPKVWFTRSLDGGKTFERQRDLLDGDTRGIDHVAIAASGRTVGVFWLDARGGEDPSAPVTSTIWYSVSENGGKTFGPNRKVSADTSLRACACCSFAASVGPGGSASITYRSGIRNVRDIWRAEGDALANKWALRQVSSTGWVFEGCPMDGPRAAGPATAYMTDGAVYYKELGKTPVRLGPGKYANLCSGREGDCVIWQDGPNILWRWMGSGESGRISSGSARATVVLDPAGRPLIVH